MEKIDYARKIDTVGRIMIPSPLRKQYGLNTGKLCDFYIHVTEEGETYLAIKCPNLSNEIITAMEVLKNAGLMD